MSPAWSPEVRRWDDTEGYRCRGVAQRRATRARLRRAGRRV